MEHLSFAELLSNELLVHIFTELDVKTFVNAGSVSKRWYELTKDEFLWRKLYARNFCLDESSFSPETISYQDLYRKIVLYQNWKEVGCSKEEDEVWQASFSPNGKYLACSGRFHYLKIWRVIVSEASEPSVTLEHYHTFNLNQESIGRHNWSPNSEKIVVTDKESSVFVLDVTNRKCLKELSYTPTDCFAAFSDDNTIVNNTAYSRLLGKKRFVTLSMVDASNDFQTSVSVDVIVRQYTLFNTVTPLKKYIAIRVADYISPSEIWLVDLDLCKTESSQAEKSENGNRRISKEECKVILENGAEVFGLCFSKDERYLVTTIKSLEEVDGNLQSAKRLNTHLWDLKTMTLLKSWTTGECSEDFFIFPSMALHDQIILTGSGDGSVSIIHRNESAILHQFKAHEKLVNGVEMHPTLDLLVTASDSFEVKIWRPEYSTLNDNVFGAKGSATNLFTGPKRE